MSIQEQRPNPNRRVVVPLVALIMVAVGAIGISRGQHDELLLGRSEEHSSNLKRKMSLSGSAQERGVDELNVATSSVDVKAAATIAGASYALNGNGSQCVLVKMNPGGDSRGVNFLPSDGYPHFLSAAGLVASTGATTGSLFAFKTKDLPVQDDFAFSGNELRIGNDVHTLMNGPCQVGFSPWMNVVFDTDRPHGKYQCQTLEMNPKTGGVVTYYSKAMPQFQSGAAWYEPGVGGYLFGTNEGLGGGALPIDGPFLIQEVENGVGLYNPDTQVHTATFLKAPTCNTIRYC